MMLQRLLRKSSVETNEIVLYTIDKTKAALAVKGRMRHMVMSSPSMRTGYTIRNFVIIQKTPKRRPKKISMGAFGSSTLPSTVDALDAVYNPQDL